MSQSPTTLKTLQTPKFPQNNLLITPYIRSYKTKPPKYEAAKMQNYFKAVNIGNRTNYSHMDEHEFALNVLETGMPHLVGSWLDSPNKKDEVKGYMTNIIEFDIDDIKHLSVQRKRELEKKLFNNFYMVQRSFSSSEDYSDPRYHVYERVVPLEDCSYESWAYAYKRRMEYWEQELGISFDHSQHLLKMIYASGKKVHINRKQKPINLQQYVDEFIEEKKKMKKKKRKVSNRQVARRLANNRFNNQYQIIGVNFDAIVKALEELPLIDDYDSWFKLLQTFYSMMIEGLIDRNQVYELCENIDDGEGKYKEELDKIERYGYTGRTMGSFIYDLQSFDVDTKGIFQLSEKYKMRVDREWKIEGYLTDNAQICKEFKELLLNSPGKRILFIGDTGIGKSKFILDILDEFNGRLQNFKKMYRSISSLSYSIMSIPRRNLINNLQNSFSTEKSAVLTGSDEMIKGERESIIANNDKFLTTPDHAHIILDMKLTEGERVCRSGYDLATLDILKHHRIMVLDECHMLANDSAFKAETIERYLSVEDDHLKNGGVVLHMTATPETLTIEGVYDLVIKVTQKNRKPPFRNAEYKVLSGKDTNEIDSMMLKLIRESIKNKPTKKILMFIENKKLIELFRKDLIKKGIKAIGIYSRKEKERSKEELSIIELGHIPDDVQVILGTTAISAGISIISGFNELAETWVYCSSSSMNHEFTRLVQMSNRFRTSKEVPSYASFKIFFQESSPEKQGNVFRYHSYVKEQAKKAKNSKIYIELLRGAADSVIGDLDEIERNCGLYSNNDGYLRINYPAIQSEGIMIKTYNNFNNYHSLIKELEDKFKCQFIDSNESVKVNKNELLKKNKIHGDSKSIIKQIASRKDYFDQLKDEYMAGIKDGELDRVRNILKGGIKKDLNYFLETEHDYGLVRKVFQAHQNPPRRKTLCFVDDLKAIKKIDDIKKREQITLEVQLVEVLERVFARSRKKLEFNSGKEVDGFLENCLARKLKEKGLKLDASRFKPRSFKKMLNIEVRPSNGKEFYTLLGFKDEKYLKLTYGLLQVNGQIKEVA